jgi:two-component system sensor histidine kinase VicK
MQNEFIDVVAHEIRTPITPIIGLTEHVRNKIKDKEQRELLDIVINDSKKLQILTEKILDVTRIEGNLFKLEKERFSLNQLILNVVKDFEDNIKDREENKKIKFEYGNNFDTEYLINADIMKIGQVISNLIENSIKFISEEEESDKKEEGVISITIEKKEISTGANDYNIREPIIIVSIKDNGTGIDKEILPKLFKKFTSKSFQGTGLGLYLYKKIVEAHDGKIWGENNKEEKGATFSFSLPLNK